MKQTTQDDFDETMTEFRRTMQSFEEEMEQFEETMADTEDLLSGYSSKQVDDTEPLAGNTEGPQPAASD